jgi:DNA helicase-2/ATP-dependent DNA helicase PcrA
MSGLNESQQIAANTLHGPVLILAGAGSGKTRTITHRIENMLKQGIPANSVLAVSFTNKAAREMLERVRHLIPSGKRRGLTLCTFHALGLKILKVEIQKLGYHPEFNLYDTSDQSSIIKDGLSHYRADKSFDRKVLLGMLGQLKNLGIAPHEYESSRFFDAENDYCQALSYLYPYYQEKLKFYNALDFDDILFKTVELFDKFPELAEKYSKIYQYIMIDEYQDTNPLQFKMIKHLTSTHHNICVVGDDDQSIYAFRGADIENILNFESTYPKTKVIKLEENYRSTTKILNLANNVIVKNKKRKAKTMWSQNTDGPLPYLWIAQDSIHEAQLIADEINRLRKNEIHLSEIAILYRSNTQTPPLEDELRLSQIPYNMIGGQKFYDKKEIKDMIAYLSVIHNYRDELALRRILNVPNRGVGIKTLERHLANSSEKKIALFESLHANDANQLSFGVEDTIEKNKEIRSFGELIRKYQDKFKNGSLSQILKEMIDDIGYKEYMAKQYPQAKHLAARLNDLEQLIQSAQRFESQDEYTPNLRNFLEKILLADNQDSHIPTRDEDGRKNEVTLMTLHSSKGLEFHSVFLVGVEEELLPHKRSLMENTDLSEERRLCYVGITRAKVNLVMTRAKERIMYNKKMPRLRSRFFDEMDEFFIEQDRTTFGHMSEDEVVDYKKQAFNDLFKMLD